MSRRRVTSRKKTLPDLIYNSEIVSLLINYIMWDGNKQLAKRIVYGAMDILSALPKKESTEKQDCGGNSDSMESNGVTKSAALSILEEAVNNARIQIMVRSRRVGGATYQVPTELTKSAAIRKGIKNIVVAFRADKKMRIATERLAEQIKAAANNEGAAIKQKLNIAAMANASRVNAHFRG